MRSSLPVLLLCLSCSPELVEGKYACNDSAECPSGFECFRNRCYSDPPDARMDAMLPIDGSVSDGSASDGSASDGSTIDAGDGAVAECMPPTDLVDVLIVADRTTQDTIIYPVWAEAARLLVRTVPAGLDVQIGVTSSSVNAGSCTSGQFDDGILLSDHDNSFGGGACPASAEPPILTTPFASEDEDQLSCLVQIGTDGCGAPQYLEATALALAEAPDNLEPVLPLEPKGATDNSGFLRDDSALVVIYLTTGDDCSSPDAAIGGFGRTGCIVDKIAGDLQPLTRYTEWLLALRDPGRLVISLLGNFPSGPEDLDAFAAALDCDGPGCATTCVGPFEYNPPQRLVQFAAAVQAAGGHAVATSACPYTTPSTAADLFTTALAEAIQLATGAICEAP